MIATALRAYLRDPRRSAIIVRALPFGLFIAVLALRGALHAGNSTSGEEDTRLLYGVQAGAALAALCAWHRRYAELSTSPGSIGAWLLAVGTGVAVFLLWVAPLPDWTHLGQPAATFVPVAADGSLRWDLITVRLVGAVLVVPVMEEIFWRSFLMRWIDRRDFLSLAPGAVSWFAVAASSAVFALAHDLWLAGLIAGLAYAGVYRRCGNLWYAVAAHATTNGLLAVWVLHERAWRYW